MQIPNSRNTQAEVGLFSTTELWQNLLLRQDPDVVGI